MICIVHRKASYRSFIWWVQGFAEDRSLFKDQKGYVKTFHSQDYHDMLSRLFQEMYHIRQSGGIRLTLNFGANRIHEVIDIPVIPFIIYRFQRE